MRIGTVLLWVGLLTASPAAAEETDVSAAPGARTELTASTPPAEDRATRFGVSIDRKQPLEIRSDQMEALRHEGAKQFIFKQNVEVHQALGVLGIGRVEGVEPVGADGDVGLVDLGMDGVEGAQGSTGTGVLGVGRNDHDLAMGPHGPGQHVEPDRVDSVVVG